MKPSSSPAAAEASARAPPSSALVADGRHPDLQQNPDAQRASPSIAAVRRQAPSRCRSMSAAIGTFARFRQTRGAHLQRSLVARRLRLSGEQCRLRPLRADRTVSEAQFDGLFSVHLKGPFFLTQTLLPFMKDGGAIVNMTSATTRVATAGVAPYAAFKGGLEVLTRYMAKEFGERRIRVNACRRAPSAPNWAAG
jgi:NAD(P)-dependent dehydrogenase (short-subunit alcohol dehydrogenase family)